MKSLVLLSLFWLGSSPPTLETPLGPDGWGPVTIGMSEDEIAAILGPHEAERWESSECEHLTPRYAPAGLHFMMQEGRLTRLSVYEDNGMKTVDGFGIGSSASDITAFYGPTADISPHEYGGPDASYITIWTVQGEKDEYGYIIDGSARGLRYETNDDGLVEAFHVGDDSIQLIEGCS